MPTYEYKCLSCDHHFDAFQSMNDDRLTDCPLDECDGDLKRLIGTGAGIIFKGSGFYETDYRSDSYKAGAKADKKSSSSGSDSKSKSTTKPDSAKSSSKPAKSKPAKSD